MVILHSVLDDTQSQAGAARLPGMTFVHPVKPLEDLFLMLRWDAYASVYMTINPEVRIDVNRRDVVVGLEGVNADGEYLIAGYQHKKKDLVMDELVDRAIDMGYLHEGGKVTLTLDAQSNEWIVSHGVTLTAQLNQHLDEKLSVTIEVTNQTPPDQSVTIPLGPGSSGYGEEDYGKDISSGSRAEDDGAQPEDNLPVVDSPYGDNQTDYGLDDDPDDGQTDYGDDSTDHDGQTEYAPAPDEDGQSNYEVSEDDDGQSNDAPMDSDDGQSNYEVSDNDNGQSSYETSDTDDGQSGYGQSNYEDD